MASRTPVLSLANAQLAEAMLHNDMATFAEAMFQIVNPGRPLVRADYLNVMFSWLEDLAHGRRTHVIITMPPRFGKSYAVSVALPAFLLGHYPHLDFMGVSYSQDLAKTFARQTQTIMQSPLYGSIFGDVLISGRQPLAELRTLNGGVRRATSIGGTATGHGADVLAIDDPQKPGETFSDALRRATNSSFETTFYSRGNDPDKRRIAIVMQRLHEDDFVGHVLGLGESWDVLNLPAIADEDQQIAYRTALGPRIWRRGAGQSLHPERVSLQTLAKTRVTLGEARWATQYQQRPTPAGGGLVQKAWLKPYDSDELQRPFDRVVQTWDTANTVNPWSDFSACVTIGVRGKHYFILDVFRDKMIFPDLKRAVLRLAQEFRPETIYIEEHQSGVQVLQQLRSENFGLIQGVRPRGDKQLRMSNQSAVIEAGRVHVPHDAPWLAAFIHELVMFPSGTNDDQVDALAQALEVLNTRDAWARAEEFWRPDYQRKEEELWVLQGPPECGVAFDIDGAMHRRGHDGYFHLTQAHAASQLSLFGWKRIR